MKHLFPRTHLPHPHVAAHLAEFTERLLSGHEQWREPPARTVPAAEDWPEWHWYPEEGK